jgi:hypothetical protein
MSRSLEFALGALALCLLAPACGDNPTGTTGDPLLPVVGIMMTRLNPYYPERPPGTALNVPVCQVVVSVEVTLPDSCAGFTDFRNLGREGDTFRFEIHSSPARGCGPPVSDSLDLCLPGLGEDPPPPALSSGHYGVIVNGFSGGFDIP